MNHNDVMEGKDSKILTVVLGAGASHDCAGSGTALLDPQLKPPLAGDIFGPQFQGILERYPRVEGRSDEVRRRLKAGENLEQILRDLLDSALRSRNNWVLDIPRYLRDLFWTISKGYLRSSSKFDTLVRYVLDYSFERVLFLSVNYDLFLEAAIERYEAHEFTSVNSYVPDSKKWLLVKPHGSVNWARTLENCPKYGDGLPRAPSDLQEAPRFTPGIRLVYRSAERNDYYVPGSTEEVGYLYPQIVVPVDRPKEFVCPPSHSDQASAFVAECRNFLLIGFSAHDDDILKLLKRMPARSRLTVVSSGDARKVYDRIISGAVGLEARGLVTSFWDDGFASYVDSLNSTTLGVS